MNTETSTHTTRTTTDAAPDRLSHAMVFVNLPVTDLDATRAFFTAVGYGFDEQMCNGEALALQLGPNIYAMLLRRDFFATFHRGSTTEPGSHELLTCLDAASAAEVDSLVDAAVAAGGREVGKQEAGDYMHGRSYADLDGHIWEILWMDVEKATAAGAFG